MAESYPYNEPGVHRINFGAIPPLPDGYSVAWHDNIEHYMGHGPGGVEGPIYWNRFRAYEWCLVHSRSLTPAPSAETEDASDG